MTANQSVAFGVVGWMCICAGLCVCECVWWGWKEAEEERSGGRKERKRGVWNK